MRIGELLIMNGLITEEQLTQALNEQVHSSKKLGELLMDQGAITELQLAEALEFQLGVPVINLSDTIVDEESVQLLDDELAVRLQVMPIERRAGKLRLAMADPLHKEAINEVQSVTGMSIQPLIAMRSQLEPMLKLYYGESESEQQLSEIILQCLEEKSNEIYLDPQEHGLNVKYRIDYVLKTKRAIPKDKQKALIKRIKRIAKINIADSRLPEDGRFRKSIDNETYDIRVSTIPTIHGEHVFLRLNKRNQEVMELSELGLSDEHIRRLEEVFQRQKGMILVSAASDTGRVATLYSFLNRLKKDGLQISTIEDPIELPMNGISQVEVNDRIGLTFAHGLQAILRQSPNIVMVGDIKDVDTAETAVKASLTDCFLLGGIQSPDALRTVKHLVEMGIDSQLIASSLTCVVQQLFVRQVCKQCAQSVPMTDDEKKAFEEHELLHPEDHDNANKNVLGNFRTLVSAHFNGKMTVIRGTGCRLCNNTGYRGQIALYEVLIISEKLRKLISEKSPHNELEQCLKEEGHKTLFYDGLLKARNGKTTLDEVLKIK